jgi:hypothetical protein
LCPTRPGIGDRVMLTNPDEQAQDAGSRTGPLWTWGWIIFWGIIAFVALVGASPASAQFVANEGFDANGSPTVVVELQPDTRLPHSDITVGLARAVGPDAAVGLRF